MWRSVCGATLGLFLNQQSRINNAVIVVNSTLQVYPGGGTLEVWMKRRFCFAIILLAASLSAQQTKSPVTSVVKEILPRQEKNIVAAVEEMPPDKFSYKPTPEQMSFGHLVVHIIDANNHLCSKAADTPAPKTEELKETDSKEKLASALKASFDFCSSALAKTDDSKLGDNIEVFPGRQGPRAFAFIALASSWADHYGTAAMYLRLNGLLPPTAQKKAASEPKK
jgi:uncharacterized damage-inducible protein DinB